MAEAIRQTEKNRLHDTHTEKGNLDNLILNSDEHTVRMKGNSSRVPAHMQKCVKCGCLPFCCTPKALLFWVILLIIIQAWPITVLYLDISNKEMYGTTLERFQATSGMKSANCKVVDFSVNHVSDKCECIQVQAMTQNADLEGSSFLKKSEREYVVGKRLHWNSTVSSFLFCHPYILSRPGGVSRANLYQTLPLP